MAYQQTIIVGEMWYSPRQKTRNKVYELGTRFVTETWLCNGPTNEIIAFHIE